ncbi:hypothetical protein HDV02_001112 [Globomyces sp. JEL0801]|nr:hypothetical protein HDV02_001112 [Globomyces sp. JEL0801]
MKASVQLTPPKNSTGVSQIVHNNQASEPITAYCLSNGPTTATILNYGATLSKFTINNIDVLLGFDDVFDYTKSHPMFGVIVGRTCNRIGNGQFELNGTTYNLPINNGPNSLHGGLVGLDKHYWDSKILSQNPPAVVFTTQSKHLDQGYPGTIEVAITYTLLNGDLSIDAVAKLIGNEVDETVINITSHPYFNLSGGISPTVEDNEIQFHHVTGTLKVNSTQIPTGEVLTTSTNPEMFFNEPATFGSRLPLVQQFRVDSHLQTQSGCVSVKDPHTKIELRVLTDACGFQLYTEPSQPPDAINLPAFRQAVILKKGEEWKQKIVYRLLQNE